ncbi:MAG: DUF4019 domain-containing protein [Acidobacteriota bacterium]|nr:DUF4019 domain-containing protein [Acidobacteriota bacterium]
MIRKPVRVLIGIALVVSVLGCSKVDAGAEKKATGNEKEEQAIAAAEAWLGLVDAGDYSKSWEGAAALFRKAVTQQQWIQSLNGVRKPLGRLVSRRVKSKQYLTQLPGAPDGDYVVIQFAASFENKKTAVETVTPMLDDGVWKVSGYFIK